VFQDLDIKVYVEKVLEDADLQEITMKTVCEKVYKHYPDFDLSHKKNMIKDTVKAVSRKKDTYLPVSTLDSFHSIIRH